MSVLINEIHSKYFDISQYESAVKTGLHDHTKTLLNSPQYCNLSARP